MKIDVLTLFPNMLQSVFSESIIGRAIENQVFSINYINIRDYSLDKHRRVDDYSYGGGPGMVMTPEPLYRAIEDVRRKDSRVIYLTPQGKVYNQAMAKSLAQEEHLVFLCGHYEGIDQRVIDHYITDEISIGDYVLTGGEISAMVVIDSIVRLLPGVLSSEASFMDESHYNGLLEHPQYTRPREFNNHKVPDVLLSGNHQLVEEWRKYQSIKNTYLKRPDIIRNHVFSKEEEVYLEQIRKEEENKL